jgi:hypothetical protein
MLQRALYFADIRGASVNITDHLQAYQINVELPVFDSREGELFLFATESSSVQDGSVHLF